MKNLLIFLLLLAPLWATADDIKPTAKETVRISKIETTFKAQFYKAINISPKGDPAIFWVFIKEDPDAIFKEYPFSVPANSKDDAVVTAIVSSMQTESFDKAMFQKMAADAAADPHISY